jgi:hypothetical protein
MKKRRTSAFFEEPFFSRDHARGGCGCASLLTKIETMRQAVIEARGVVAVMGLGLGYYPYMIAQKDCGKKVLSLKNTPK